MPGEQFTHANQTKIRQIGAAIRILVRKIKETLHMSGTVKRDPDASFLYQTKHVRSRSQMERCLRKNRLTGQ